MEEVTREHEEEATDAEIEAAEREQAALLAKAWQQEREKEKAWIDRLASCGPAASEAEDEAGETRMEVEEEEEEGEEAQRALLAQAWAKEREAESTWVNNLTSKTAQAEDLADLPEVADRAWAKAQAAAAFANAPLSNAATQEPEPVKPVANSAVAETVAAVAPKAAEPLATASRLDPLPEKAPERRAAAPYVSVSGEKRKELDRQRLELDRAELAATNAYKILKYEHEQEKRGAELDRAAGAALARLEAEREQRERLAAQEAAERRNKMATHVVESAKAAQDIAEARVRVDARVQEMDAKRRKRDEEYRSTAYKA